MRTGDWITDNNFEIVWSIRRVIGDYALAEVLTIGDHGQFKIFEKSEIKRVGNEYLSHHCEYVLIK